MRLAVQRVLLLFAIGSALSVARQDLRAESPGDDVSHGDGSYGDVSYGNVSYSIDSHSNVEAGGQLRVLRCV